MSPSAVRPCNCPSSHTQSITGSGSVGLCGVDMSIAFALIVSLRSCRCFGSAEGWRCAPRTGDHATTFDGRCEPRKRALRRTRPTFAQVCPIFVQLKSISDCDIVTHRMSLRGQHRCREQHLDGMDVNYGGRGARCTARVRFEPKIACLRRAAVHNARSAATASRETPTWAQRTSVQREGSIHDTYALSRHICATIVARTGQWCDDFDCRHGVHFDR